MRTRLSYFLAVSVVLVLALPVWAHTDKTPFDIDQTETIANTQLQPGHYELKVPPQGAEATILKNGKVIAEVPCHWIDLQSKPSEDEVISNGNTIVEVEFGGRRQAIDFTQAAKSTGGAS
ncbi:MAG: hypothetical protein ACRD4S_06450 [Candidatus Acidiferrales bacterium]